MAKEQRTKEPGNYRIMAGAFLVAIAFWFAVSMSGSFVASFEVPLTIVNLPNDRALASKLPEQVEIALEGTGWQLLFLSIGDQLQVEIPGTRLLRRRSIPTLSVMSESVKLPAGVKVIRAYPDTLSVMFDEMIEKKVPLVLADMTISFKENFGMTGDVGLEPDSVFISGAQSVLRNIKTWSIQKKDYTDLSLPVVEEVPVSDSLQGLVQVTPSKVNLSIIVEQLADVSFENVPVVVEDVPPGKEVLLLHSKVSIFVRGGVNTLSNLSDDDFTAVIDYIQIQQDTTGRVEPRILIPYSVSLLQVDPGSIPYTVRTK